MLFMVYPGMIPSKCVPGIAGGGGGAGERNTTTTTTTGGLLASSAAKKVERVKPRIFGFMVHEAARLQRWQEKIKDE
jgi:casein kinase II subunit beta